MSSRSFEPLARRFCKAVHDLMDAPPNHWVMVRKAAEEMNVTNSELIDGAVSYALQKMWLVTNGHPVDSVLLTPAGLTALKK